MSNPAEITIAAKCAPVESVLDAVVEAGLTAHHSPEQSVYLLNLLKKTGYSGFIVSEAKESYQIKDEFKALYEFFRGWKDGSL